MCSAKSVRADHASGGGAERRAGRGRRGGPGFEGLFEGGGAGAPGWRASGKGQRGGPGGSKGLSREAAGSECNREGMD